MLPHFTGGDNPAVHAVGAAGALADTGTPMTDTLSPKIIGRAADLVAQADALIVAAGAGIGVVRGCLTFAGMKVSGKPIPRWPRPNWTLWTWPAQEHSRKTLPWPGASMVIGWRSTAGQHPMQVLRFCGSGLTASLWAATFSPAMWMVNFKRPS